MRGALWDADPKGMQMESQGLPGNSKSTVGAASMAPVLGGVLTASEACPGATLLRPGTAGPAPARAEDIAPAVADPLPTESSIGASPGGQGPWKPGEGGVGSCLHFPNILRSFSHNISSKAANPS